MPRRWLALIRLSALANAGWPYAYSCLATLAEDTLAAEGYAGFSRQRRCQRALLYVAPLPPLPPARCRQLPLADATWCLFRCFSPPFSAGNSQPAEYTLFIVFFSFSLLARPAEAENIASHCFLRFFSWPYFRGHVDMNDRIVIAFQLLLSARSAELRLADSF